MESWSQRVVESSSLESYRSLGLLGLRDGYLSGPFPYSSLVYKVTQLIINSLLAAFGPVSDKIRIFSYLSNPNLSFGSRIFNLAFTGFWTYNVKENVVGMQELDDKFYIWTALVPRSDIV